MKVSTEPVRRRTLSLLEKGRICVEAYSTEKNIKPTARLYNVKSNQIRKWKELELDVAYLHFINTDQEIKRQRHEERMRGTAAERAVAQVASDESDIEDSSMVRQEKEQSMRSRRKKQKVAHRTNGGGRKSKFSDSVVAGLKKFFDEFRSNDYTIHIRLMVSQARLLDPTLSDVGDVALRQRIYRLMTGTWNISWRKGTHKAQNTRHTARLMRGFHRYIRQKMEMLELTPSQVFNFDETDVQFTPHLTSTYDYRGSRTIKQKEIKGSSRCTVFIGGSMDGNKCPPMLIFLGKDTKDGRIKKQLREKRGFPNEMEYRVQANAWMDEVGMLEWIDKVWRPIAQQHGRTMLLLDTFQGHMTTKVTNELSRLNTEVEWIPAGYTGKLQPMDVGINKPFKNYMCETYMDWMKKNINQKPTREVVAVWVLDCWNRITQQICINAFKGAGYLTKFGGGEAETEQEDDISDCSELEFFNSQQSSPVCLDLFEDVNAGLVCN